ncbi:hypothetical protein AKO1_006100 [Acrasis kona]|uniref:RZ-type domain-containing protein n=1 Tax=Acrasis kona TaxID=1008807 RepID=A0AAW2YJP1_9EUKA
MYGGCSLPCHAQLPCGHTCPMNCHPKDRDHIEYKCMKKCGTGLDCGHKCAASCHDGAECPPCSHMITRKLESCGHDVNVKCSDNLSSVVCIKLCNKELPCGHKCMAKCHECLGGVCKPCETNVTVDCPTCNNSYNKICSGPSVCTNPCSEILPCGHPCSGTCGNCVDGHQKCNMDCQRILFCGHKCQGKHTCSTNCPECNKKCERKCHHTKCRNKCKDRCIPCKEPCMWECIHTKCTKLCYELCDREPCNERCPKKLECGHQCRGLCGEPCPTCIECDSTKKPEHKQWRCPISLETSSSLDHNELVYKLDCKHSFTLSMLDQYMNVQSNQIGRKLCPSCKKAIFNSPRYHNVFIKESERIEGLKVYRINQTRDEVVRAVNASLTGTFSGSASGHWFQCPNGHYYVIGECGGAMQTSKCPDCNATIGGQSHQLAAGNSHSNIDGSRMSAFEGLYAPFRNRNL